MILTSIVNVSSLISFQYLETRRRLVAEIPYTCTCTCNVANLHTRTAAHTCVIMMYVHMHIHVYIYMYMHTCIQYSTLVEGFFCRMMHYRIKIYIHMYMYVHYRTAESTNYLYMYMYMHMYTHMGKCTCKCIGTYTLHTHCIYIWVKLHVYAYKCTHCIWIHASIYTPSLATGLSIGHARVANSVCFRGQCMHTQGHFPVSQQVNPHINAVAHTSLTPRYMYKHCHIFQTTPSLSTTMLGHYPTIES